MRHCPLQVVLLEHLMLLRILCIRILYCAFDILSDNERTLGSIVVPPTNQCLIVGRTIAYLPINLRNIIINPALANPLQHIGIQVVVVLRTIGLTATWVTLLIAINTERRHTKLHPRLCLMYRLIHVMDEKVHVLSTPVVAVHVSAIHGIRTVIRNLQTCHGIGIEIIVDVQSIDIITTHDVVRNLTDILAVLRNTWVEEPQTIILEETIGMLHIVRTRERWCSLRLGTEGINPSMQLHTTFVALLHHPSQGVPCWVGYTSLLAR